MNWSAKLTLLTSICSPCYTEWVPTALHTTLLTLAIILAYWWLHIPWLVPYSLQAFTLVILLYFVSKRLSKAKLWHIAPAAQSMEMVFATFAFMILIGATGNTTSIFFPLTFVHLFFLVLATEMSTALLITLLIVLFHYGMSPHTWQQELPSLLTIPLISLFFLFTKHQYDEVQREKTIISQEEQALQNCELQARELQTFTTTFLQPKIQQLQDLSSYAAANQAAIQGQLTLIQLEIEKLLRPMR